MGASRIAVSPSLLLSCVATDGGAARRLTARTTFVADRHATRSEERSSSLRGFAVSSVGLASPPGSLRIDRPRSRHAWPDSRWACWRLRSPVRSRQIDRRRSRAPRSSLRSARWRLRSPVRSRQIDRRRSPAPRSRRVIQNASVQNRASSRRSRSSDHHPPSDARRNSGYRLDLAERGWRWPRGRPLSWTPLPPTRAPSVHHSVGTSSARRRGGPRNSRRTRVLPRR